MHKNSTFGEDRIKSIKTRSGIFLWNIKIYPLEEQF